MRAQLLISCQGGCSLYDFTISTTDNDDIKPAASNNRYPAMFTHLLVNENYLTTLFSNASSTSAMRRQANRRTHSLFVCVCISRTCAACVYVTILLSFSAYDADSIYSFESL